MYEYRESTNRFTLKEILKRVLRVEDDSSKKDRNAEKNKEQKKEKCMGKSKWILAIQKIIIIILSSF